MWDQGTKIAAFNGNPSKSEVALARIADRRDELAWRGKAHDRMREGVHASRAEPLS